MDPFSGIASAVGLIDVLWRISSYLRNVKDSTGRIEGDISILQGEIDALITADESIEKLRKTVEDASLESPISHTSAARDLWDNVERNRESCKEVLLKLEEKLKYIIGDDQKTKTKLHNEMKKAFKIQSADVEKVEAQAWDTTDHPAGKVQYHVTGKFDGLRKTLRRQSTDPELAQIHMSLSQYHDALHVLLTSLNITYTKTSQEATGNAIGELSDKTDALHSRLSFQLTSLRQRVSSGDDASLRDAIIAAANIASRPLNRHFSLPDAISSHFTGRGALLEKLQKTLDDDDSSQEEYKSQKRFVVQGLGGSGKTQFCCKFAELNRQRFWGVFYINASSYETAKEGFAAISKIGGVDPNERAAKSWLASLEQPWLLIIDNADDPSVLVEKFFPEGERGFILITTRVPDNLKHGTVGPKFYQFENLETEAATKLLLKSAQVKRPWDEKTITLANSITSALGCLPLALVHAGSAIANKLCELAGYLKYFKRYLQAIHRATANNKRAENSVDIKYMSVYSSYEVVYSKLEQSQAENDKDAVELLKIFAYFDRENIKFAVLMAAAKNPGLEAAARMKAEQEKLGVERKPRSWSQFIRELIFELQTKVLKDRSRPVVSTMLGDVLRGTLNVEKYEDRLRAALYVLNQWSLANYNQEKDSYSIHPLVHVWLRERPQMRLSEQAVWSQAAADTLAQSILLPVYGNSPTKEEMEVQRSLLLHLIHLRNFRKEIQEKFRENRQGHGRLFLPLGPKSDLMVTDRYQAIQAAKFGYIYFICQYWSEAEKFQEAVRDFLVTNIGLENELSMRISLFLAKTYCLGEGRFNDAANVTEQVLQAAEKVLGDRYSMTLDIMDELGTIRNYQGRFPEAEDLFRKAIKGRTELLGADHQDTLCSIDNLGQVYWNCFDFIKAKNQHEKAIAGMEKHSQMGPDHEKTLAAKENLALAYREIGQQHYREAHELMEEVVAKRSKLFGRESPFTLMAQSNLAYVKHAMGDYVEAEKIIRQGLPIGERNLGEDHHGVMAAKRRLAEILTAQKKYDEAEEILTQLLDRSKYTGGVRVDGAIVGDYKDRVYTLYQVVEFWEKRGNIKKALDACDELCEILKKSVHRLAQMAEDKRKDLRSRSEGSSSFPDSGLRDLGAIAQV